MEYVFWCAYIAVQWILYYGTYSVTTFGHGVQRENGEKPLQRPILMIWWSCPWTRIKFDYRLQSLGTRSYCCCWSPLLCTVSLCVLYALSVCSVSEKRQGARNVFPIWVVLIWDIRAERGETFCPDPVRATWGERNRAKCLPRGSMSHGKQTLLWHLLQHGNMEQRHGFCSSIDPKTGSRKLLNTIGYYFFFTNSGVYFKEANSKMGLKMQSGINKSVTYCTNCIRNISCEFAKRAEDLT